MIASNYTFTVGDSSKGSHLVILCPWLSMKSPTVRATIIKPTTKLYFSISIPWIMKEHYSLSICKGPFDKCGPDYTYISLLFSFKQALERVTQFKVTDQYDACYGSFSFVSSVFFESFLSRAISVPQRGIPSFLGAKESLQVNRYETVR